MSEEAQSLSELGSGRFQSAIDAGPMSRLQWGVVATTAGISMMDGYDVLSGTFVVPHLAQSWGLGPSRLGLILTVGLFGIALGALLIASLADLFGRRPMLLVALAIAAAGMLLAAQAGSLTSLVACRFLTGLGIGTVMAVTSSVAAEWANRRWRPLAIALIVMGFPAGGMIAGLVATALVARFGWQVEFLAGFALTAITILAAIVLVPEPLQSLLARDGPERLVRVNVLLARLGHPPVDALSPPVRVERSYAAVFAPRQRRMTVWITVFQLFLMQCILFVLNWLPQMVARAGAAMTTASLTGTLASAAGIVGGLVFGATTTVENIRRLTMLSAVGLGLATAALGVAPASPVLLVSIGAACGIFAYSSQAGFYTILPGCFGLQARATGIGFVLGVARLGSAASPLIAGELLSAGLGRAGVCALFAMLSLAAAALFAIEPVDGKASQQQ